MRWLASALALLTITFVACGSAANDAHSTATSPPPTTSNSPPATEATNQAAPGPYVVAISAGHGGPNNIGAVHYDTVGNVDLIEKDLNLDVARRLDELLRAGGYGTVLIRDGDYSLAATVPGDFNASVRLSRRRARTKQTKRTPTFCC